MKHRPPYNAYVLVGGSYRLYTKVWDRAAAMKVAVATTAARVEEVMFTNVRNEPVAYVWPRENRYQLV